jgi:hypothetical protein
LKTELPVYVVLILSLFLLPYLDVAFASTNSTEPYEIGSTPFGVPYQEWLGKFWTYWLAIPNSQHPGVDYDPQKCSVNQSGPVWFLPDVITKGDAPYTRVDFSCQIPQGKAIFLPLSTGACWLNLPEFSYVQDKTGANPEVDSRLRACATEAQEKTKFDHISVDGSEFKDLVKNARSTTSFFNVTSPDDPVTDIFQDVKSGTSRAIADGYFLLLPPLPPGDHLIEFLVDDTIGGLNFAREGVYKISVG